MGQTPASGRQAKDLCSIPFGKLKVELRSTECTRDWCGNEETSTTDAPGTYACHNGCHNTMISTRNACVTGFNPGGCKQCKSEKGLTYRENGQSLAQRCHEKAVWRLLL